jgi:predicted house-cleaning noncanonical NTP pyrophosphatase (MazG superfamily)
MQDNTPLITRQSLEDFGIDLSDRDVDSLLAHLNDTLEERIGAEITEYLSDEQLDELAELQETKSEDEVAAWINNNIENLADIAQDEANILLGELAENSDNISAAA